MVEVRSRVGFTLLELMVALSLGAIALLGARAVYDALGDVASGIGTAAATDDARSNGERLLRTLIMELEPGTERDSMFHGDRDNVTFPTRCRTGGGWKEHCNVRLSLEPASTGELTQRLIVRSSTGDSLVLLDSLIVSRFAFLDDASAGGRWIARWTRSVAPPLAVGILSPYDTLILRVGVRQ